MRDLWDLALDLRFDPLTVGQDPTIPSGYEGMTAQEIYDALVDG